MQAEIRDPLENLFPDSALGTPPSRRLTLDVARGCIASAHILVTDLVPGQRLRLRVLPSGSVGPEPRWFRLLDVPVEENTGLRGFTESSMGDDNRPNPHVVRRAPFRTYDAMQPVKPVARVEAATQAFRVHVPIACDARPGIRRFILEVSNNRSCISLQFDVRIHKPVVPLVGRDSIPYTNWFSVENTAARHGLKMWSEAHWSMLRRYAALMAHARQNTFWVPLGLVFEKHGSEVVLQRERLRRYVQTFSRSGLHFIEGGHVAHRTGGVWASATFDLVLGGPRATSPDGNAQLASIARQLMEEIERNRWRTRWIQHVADEPITENAADYRILAGMVRKYMPGLPLLDAICHTDFPGAVDYWCPQAQYYQEHRDAFEAQRRLGDHIWYYTCCFPGGPWLNRLLDQELIRPVYLGWAGVLFDLHGFLHWGFNHYRDDQDPFESNVVRNWGGATNSLPAGDTHIAYPGPDGPWSGLRLEAQREGFEDAELLRVLRTRHPRKAAAVIGKVVRGFDHYVKDVRAFRTARRALLQALDE